MIGVRNAAYVVGCEVVPYLEAPIPRHRRDLIIDETCSLRCDLLAEIFGDAGKKRASRIRYEILGRVGRRHGKAGLHGGGLAILRLGKDAKIKRRGGYTTKDHREHFVPRSEVYKFCDHPAKVLVAPAMAIERGFNIVDRGGHAVFTSLIFSVRPMGTPHDLGGRYRKLNGLIEREVGDYPANPGEFATEVRASAWRTWKTMERDENLPMGAWRTMGRQFLVDDAISTLMVTIIQIFGRLARLADKERPAPHVYFADAAFRGGDGKLSFRTLEELGAYMERLMHDSDQPEVAKALYGPFYESFRKGIGNVGL